MPNKRLTPKERIDKLLIDKGNNPKGCWIAKKTGLTICVSPGVVLMSTRFSYQTYIGEIPRDKFVLHSCKNRSCLNPDHLYTDDNLKIDNPQKGSQRYNAKIDESTAREIKYLLGEGNMKQVEIAKMFNISDRIVSDIKHEKSWVHV
jgi:hypothetical protein